MLPSEEAAPDTPAGGRGIAAITSIASITPKSCFHAGWPWVVRLILLLSMAANIALCAIFIHEPWFLSFCILFILRYTRLFGHCVAAALYKAAKVLPDPAFSPADVTVILPTIDPEGPDFDECIRSILSNRPKAVLVVTVGHELLEKCRGILTSLLPAAGATKISLSAFSEPHKRKQIAHALPKVETAVTILANDHVFWPSTSFLSAVLAPFNDKDVGVVATKKRVRRTTPGSWTWLSIVNFIACNYLQRHNWELRSSNAMDGGVFVVSGRTAIYRTELLNTDGIMPRFCHETFFFGLCGSDRGLGPDDNNFLTREALHAGWKIKFQDTEDATIETTLGDWPKFKGQLIRWARTTFRSNPVLLRNFTFLRKYSWSWFMVYWAGIVNFALAWDAMLLLTLAMSKGICSAWVVLLALFIIWTKVVKIIPNLLRHPSDFPLIICQIAFAYLHTVIKFWALITFWDCDWSGRVLSDVNTDSEQAAEDANWHLIE